MYCLASCQEQALEDAWYCHVPKSSFLLTLLKKKLQIFLQRCWWYFISGSGEKKKKKKNPTTMEWSKTQVRPQICPSRDLGQVLFTWRFIIYTAPPCIHECWCTPFCHVINVQSNYKAPLKEQRPPPWKTLCARPIWREMAVKNGHCVWILKAVWCLSRNVCIGVIGFDYDF